MSSGHTDEEFQGKFCGTYEIAEYANVTKSQISHWLRTDWFPKPLDKARMGRIWSYPEVVAALKERGYPRPVDESGKKIVKKRYSLAAVAVVE